MAAYGHILGQLFIRIVNVILNLNATLFNSPVESILLPSFTEGFEQPHVLCAFSNN